MAKKEAQGPQFVRYFGPVIEALKKLGGSGRPDEVRDQIAVMLNIGEEEQSKTLISGESRFSNQVAWARFYLVKAEYLDSSTRGVWSLTDKARNETLSQSQALSIFKTIHQLFNIEKDSNLGDAGPILPPNDNADVIVADSEDYRSTLMNILRTLPPEGFERLCQRLLRESGFERVTVTGKSSDGGIDGIGILQMNPFVSFKVLFQCKRYTGAVSASQIRDFRGAMMGRTDKGIIMTTGSFTADANKEAIRDGVPPIELVDGEKLIDMFESLELGLKPKKSYNIDNGFFEEFR
ncbi:MAG: restriction endonuclease [Chloroflexi bacterium]|nr:restriction endonuclease [Chloroflexota bacterium]